MTDFLPIRPADTPPPRLTSALSARAAAEKLEATFLAEMLKSAGLGAQAGGFSGGIGEDQFASFHRLALAEEMVRAGGIGLAESFYQALVEKSDDT